MFMVLIGVFYDLFRRKKFFKVIDGEVGLLGLVRMGLRSKGFLYVTFGQMFNAALGGFFFFVAARILSVSEYGNISYYVAIGGFAATFAFLGLTATIPTFYPKEGRETLIKQAALLTFILSLVVAGGLVFLGYWFAAPIVLGFVCLNMSMVEALGKRRYKRYAYIVFSARVLQLLLVGAFYLVSAFSGFFLGNLDELVLVAYSVPLFLAGYDYFKNFLGGVWLRFDEIRSKLKFTLHTWTIALTSASRTQLDKILVGMLFGMAFLGNYNLAFQFLIVFMVIPGALFAYLLPEKSSGSARREVEVVGLAVAVVITVLGILFAPYVIRWLFPNFEGSIQATQVISLAVLPACLANIKSSELLSRERSGIVLVGGAAALIVHVAGIVIFGLWYQTVGFALAFLLSQVALAIVLYACSSEKVGSWLKRREHVSELESKIKEGE